MNDWLTFLQGASNAAASNVSGPVDLIAWALRKAGVPIDRPVGGSEWMAQQGLTKPAGGVAGLLGEVASMSAPIAVAAKAPQIAAGLLQMGENAAAPRAPGLLHGQRGAITADTKPVLEQMSRQEFLGKPKIVGASNAKDLKPRVLISVAEADPVPFLGGKYQARYTPHGAAVFDNEKVIASYNFGDTLVVDPKYRKKGIGEELVYQFRTYFPEAGKATTRNKGSQHIQENVWERIQNDLSNGLLSEPLR